MVLKFPNLARRVPGPTHALGKLPGSSTDCDTIASRTGRTEVGPQCDKPLVYGAYAGPPTAKHVADVEVRVVIVLVWAPVVDAVVSPQVDDTACLNDCQGKHGSSKPPNSLPRSLHWSINMAPDANGCGPKHVTGYDADCSAPWLCATASKATLGWMTVESL